MLNQVTADSAVYREMAPPLYADYGQEEESIPASALLFKPRVGCATLNLRLLAWQHIMFLAYQHQVKHVNSHQNGGYK